MVAISVGDWGDERRRREDRGAKGAEGVGCRDGVSPSPLERSGEGAVPPPQKIFDFELYKASFVALLVLLCS